VAKTDCSWVFGSTGWRYARICDGELATEESLSTQEKKRCLAILAMEKIRKNEGMSKQTPSIISLSSNGSNSGKENGLKRIP